MPVFSSLLLVLALVLAVVIGPQTRPWSWGPAMLALGLSVLAALPVFWRRGRVPADGWLATFGALTAGWFAWRAWISPVAEFGHADLLLLCGAAGSFLSVLAIAGNAAAERVLAWGIALLLLANVAVAVMQLQTPSFSPVFAAEATTGKINGFYAHYNEAANYFIASSLLVGAAAMFGRHATTTRLLWLLLATAGLACVYFSGSRGGVFGAAVGCGVLTAVLLVIGKRRKAKWFGPAVIAVPLVCLAIGALWILGWQEVQQARGGSGINQLLDNTARLYLLGIALSCIGLHPLAGGGSRSFSWECFRFAKGGDQGDMITHRPELAHNELLQAATDYGLIGSGLLIGFLATLVLVAVLRTGFENRPREHDTRDAWRLGGLAALAGMLVQSCFSFVFHLMPGVILLGICLGQVAWSPQKPRGTRGVGPRVLLTLASICCALMLLPAGWKGSRVTHILWDTWLAKQPENSAESRIDALSEAIRVWPQAELYQVRAAIHQQTAIDHPAGPEFREAAELALGDYAEAARLHPYEPAFPINQAKLLSQLGRDAEAEAAFMHGIGLQGGMEPGFRGHFSLAIHYLGKGLRLSDAQQPEPALATLELAAEEMELATARMHWVGRDMLEPRVSVHEALGIAREASGDLQGALESYNFAASLQQGKRVHYRAAVLIGKTAVDHWSKRQPSKALALFLEAKKRVGRADSELPAGITPSQRLEYLAYLDRSIAFLKGAKVEPAE